MFRSTARTFDNSPEMEAFLIEFLHDTVIKLQTATQAKILLCTETEDGRRCFRGCRRMLDAVVDGGLKARDGDELMEIMIDGAAAAPAVDVKPEELVILPDDDEDDVEFSMTPSDGGSGDGEGCEFKFEGLPNIHYSPLETTIDYDASFTSDPSIDAAAAIISNTATSFTINAATSSDATTSSRNLCTTATLERTCPKERATTVNIKPNIKELVGRSNDKYSIKCDDSLTSNPSIDVGTSTTTSNAATSTTHSNAATSTTSNAATSTTTTKKAATSSNDPRTISSSKRTRRKERAIRAINDPAAAFRKGTTESKLLASFFYDVGKETALANPFPSNSTQAKQFFKEVRSFNKNAGYIGEERRRELDLITSRSHSSPAHETSTNVFNPDWLSSL